MPCDEQKVFRENVDIRVDVPKRHPDPTVSASEYGIRGDAETCLTIASSSAANRLQ